MKALFKNIFGKKEAGDKRTSELATQIFVASLASAQGIVNSEEYKNFPMFRISATLCSGYINIVDRFAFANIPEKRSKVMNQIMAEVATHLIETFISGRLTIDNPEEAMLAELNSGQISLGQFSKFAATIEGESPKGTFMWEFGKMFAKDLGCPEDIVIIDLGISLLTNMTEVIDLNEHLPK
jgi:hypothetical protein